MGYRKAGLGDLMDQMAQWEPLPRKTVPDDVARLFSFSRVTWPCS